MNAAQRYRTAHHEAGHSVAAFILGRPVGPVSIKPCRVHLGVSFRTKARVPEAEWNRVGLPAILLPARLRRTVETEAVIALAGPTAEDVAVTEAEGSTYVNEATPDHTRAEQLVNTLGDGGLSPTETVMLERARREPGESDEDKARYWSQLVADHSLTESLAHLSWLQTLTRSLVMSPRFQRLEYALAPRLLEAEVLGGRAVRMIFKAADRGFLAERGPHDEQTTKKNPAGSNHVEASMLHGVGWRPASCAGRWRGSFPRSSGTRKPASGRQEPAARDEDQRLKARLRNSTGGAAALALFSGTNWRLCAQLT
jgi:hypothetical protein